MPLNTKYLSSSRGIIKIAQIVIGFIVCSFLCAAWHGGRSCFGEGRLGFCSGLNFVVLIINIIILILNFLSIDCQAIERVFNVVCAVLFLAAIALIVWFLIDMRGNRTSLIIAGICIALEFLLFAWDAKLVQA